MELVPFWGLPKSRAPQAEPRPSAGNVNSSQTVGLDERSDMTSADWDGETLQGGLIQGSYIVMGCFLRWQP